MIFLFDDMISLADSFDNGRVVFFPSLFMVMHVITNNKPFGFETILFILKSDSCSCARSFARAHALQPSDAMIATAKGTASHNYGRDTNAHACADTLFIPFHFKKK